MEAILFFVGGLLALFLLGSPFFAVIWIIGARRRIDDLHSRLMEQEGTVRWMQTQLEGLAAHNKRLHARLEAQPADARWAPPAVVEPAAAEAASRAAVADEAAREGMATPPPEWAKLATPPGAWHSPTAEAGREATGWAGAGPAEAGPAEAGLTAAAPARDGGLPDAGSASAASARDAEPTPARLIDAPTLVDLPAPALPAAASPAFEAAQPPLDEPAAPPAASTALQRPPIDWESLLGVRGAAWVGGIALVIAGSLFAKYSIDNNLIPPVVRVALIILFGTGAVASSELVLRRGYGPTANAMAGAGVALLYAGFFAGHAVYQLIPLPVTFALMILTTIVACLLAIRHDAMFIAILGLLGGFATPLLLNTGQDRPAGLFTYLLLLDAGLLFIAARRGWRTLALLSLAATLVLQVVWFSTRMHPEKMPVVAVAFTLFAVLYLLLPSFATARDRQALAGAATIGGLSPFLFVLYMAQTPIYSEHWQILFAFTACLDGALVVIALRRNKPHLLLSGAVATAALLWIWSGQRLGPDNLWGATLCAVALTALLNLPTALSRLSWLRPRGPEGSGEASGGGTPTGEGPGGLVASGHAFFEAAGLIGGGGLWFYGMALADKGLGEPPWAFLVLCLALFGVVLWRSLPRGLAYVSSFGPLALALLLQRWFFARPEQPGAPFAAHLLRDLSLPLLCAAGFMVAAALRAQSRATGDQTARTRGAHDEVGALLALGVAYVGLLLSTTDAVRGGDPRPLFLALGVQVFLLLSSALRRRWGRLILGGALASALFVTSWHARRFHAADVWVALPIYAGLYLLFLALPFLLSPGHPDGDTAADAPGQATPLARQGAPYTAAAIAGPLFFWVLYRAFIAAFGKTAIGLLPIVLAAFSVAALALVRRRFPGPILAGDDEAADPRARLRLRNLALFAAVGLGFISLAIPLQLDRQWITLGWALEGMAVFWLYGRLPHPGLKYFGALLYLAVGMRLLLNSAVLHYEPRGLPVLNWILYTYGVSAAACLIGGARLGLVEAERLSARERGALIGGRILLSRVVQGLGLLLIFALINLEIADYFSPGRYVELRWEHQQDRDLCMSLSWGVYAMMLLGIGMWRGARALRFVSLGFMLLTILKVFLLDLANLHGLGRVLSFLGLAASLIFVSLLYQRFVLRQDQKGGHR